MISRSISSRSRIRSVTNSGFETLWNHWVSQRLFTKVSYTRVNTTVYGQNKPQNLYLNSGQPIGYFGGNDQDRILALLRYHVSTRL